MAESSYDAAIMYLLLSIGKKNASAVDTERYAINVCLIHQCQPEFLENWIVTAKSFTHPCFADKIQHGSCNIFTFACSSCRYFVEEGAEHVPFCTYRIHVAGYDCRIQLSAEPNVHAA